MSAEDNIQFDAKLNARFISYFLSAVEVARMQKVRPRLFIVSGISLALLWNAKNDEQRKIMLANNAIKIDFLQHFFKQFFVNDFSLIEYIISQDSFKIPESKILALWHLLEKRYPAEIEEVRFQLTKFLFPKQFNVQSLDQLTDKQKEKMKHVDATTAFKYAISHLFIFADLNFEGNYYHNPHGYVSIGWSAEKFFNIVRKLTQEMIADLSEILFERKTIAFDNDRIVLEEPHNVPPAYNGLFNYSSHERDEVMYENNRSLDFYDSHEKLSEQMNYMYDHLLSKNDYEMFWEAYRQRYLFWKKDIGNRIRLLDYGKCCLLFLYLLIYVDAISSKNYSNYY